MSADDTDDERVRVWHRLQAHRPEVFRWLYAELKAAVFDLSRADYQTYRAIEVRIEDIERAAIFEEALIPDDAPAPTGAPAARPEAPKEKRGAKSARLSLAFLALKKQLPKMRDDTERAAALAEAASCSPSLARQFLTGKGKRL